MPFPSLSSILLSVGTVVGLGAASMYFIKELRKPRLLILTDLKPTYAKWAIMYNGEEIDGMFEGLVYLGIVAYWNEGYNGVLSRGECEKGKYRNSQKIQTQSSGGTTARRVHETC